MGRPLQRRASVLVVEDDATLRGLLAETLASAGYSVAQAGTADEAFALAREQRPAAVVLDVDLPGVSGYEICFELRAELGEEFAIVFVSGVRVDELDQRVGAMLGANDYLVKPFEPARLLAAVTRVLGRPQRASAAAGRAALTGREVEILSLVRDGVARTAIAAQLGISPKTVGSHLERVTMKLGARTQTQAMATAVALGLLGGGRE